MVEKLGQGHANDARPLGRLSGNPEESAFADQFESRYAKMASGEAKERLAKLVNVELGIAVLRESEIDRESFSKMLAAIAK